MLLKRQNPKVFVGLHIIHIRNYLSDWRYPVLVLCVCGVCVCVFVCVHGYYYFIYYTSGEIGLAETKCGMMNGETMCIIRHHPSAWRQSTIPTTYIYIYT